MIFVFNAHRRVCDSLFASVHKTGGILMKVRAKPTGKVTRLVSISGDALEVELGAKPQNGEANGELIDFISSILKVKKRDVQVLYGEKSRDKQILVRAGLIELETARRLIEIELSS